MTSEGAIDILRNAILFAAQLAGPPIAAALFVGVVIGLLQSIMQVTEQSITFVFKLLAICLAFAAVGSHLLTSSVDYMRRTIGSIADVAR